jgi:hypothetical protein
MDDASAQEVVKYLKQHLRLASVEPSHMLTATEHWFKLRGEVNGELYILETFFQDCPAERIVQRLQSLRVADSLRAAAGKRRVIVSSTGVRHEAYAVRRKRRRPQ